MRIQFLPFWTLIEDSPDKKKDGGGIVPPPPGEHNAADITVS
jgi:hypothetical protein